MPDWLSKSQTQNYYSNLRLVISGPVFEFYHFNSDILYGRRLRIKNDKEEGDLTLKSSCKMTEKEKLLSSSRRAKRTIARLIRSNSFNWFDKNGKPYLPVVLTLTFKDEIRDIKTANSIFTDFIQRLNYSVNLNERGLGNKLSKKNLLKYSAVIEFQDKNRGGVIHYHMIFYNLPKMKKIYDRLTNIWGKGYFWVGAKRKQKNLSSTDNSKDLKKIVEYFTKYIVKSFDDYRLRNKKKHFNSRGLLKPIELEVEELIFMLNSYMPQKALGYSADQLMYKQNLSEKYFDYKQYDLSEYPEIIKKSKELILTYYPLELDNQEKNMIE